jgi:hypothetical protein
MRQINGMETALTKFLPPSMISNSMRDAMLARGLVSQERLRERSVQ